MSFVVIGARGQYLVWYPVLPRPRCKIVKTDHILNHYFLYFSFY